MKNEFLGHMLASIEYRFNKSIQYRNTTYYNFQIGNGVRTPSEIVIHLIELLEWSWNFISETETPPETTKYLNFDELLVLFYKKIKQMDQVLKETDIDIKDTKALVQGPFADILTHVGQLAMLSRLNDHPIAKEDFSKVEIKTGLQ